MFDVLVSPISTNNNLFIEASAGTGKTFTLEHLFVRRLLEPFEGRYLQVDAIACITFTRVCARELRNRIQKIIENSLHSIETGQNLAPYISQLTDLCDAKRRLQEAYIALDAATICTIHSFASKLLSEFYQNATETGEREFISETDQKKILYDILTAETDPDRAFLLNILYAQKKVDVRDLLDDLFRALWNDPKKTTCIAAADQIIDIVATQRASASQVLDALLQHAQHYCAIYTRDHEIRSDVADGFHAYARFCENPSRTTFLELVSSSFSPSQLFEKAKRGADPHPNSTIDLLMHQVGPLLERFYDTKAVIGEIANNCQKRVRDILRVQKKASHQSILYDLGDALQLPDLHAFVAKRYGAVFVDEFQDTDPLQWKILRELFLTERKTSFLYLVGDPKQSMYRFRGADIANYFSAKAHFEVAQQITLGANFRSAPRLTEALNYLFIPETEKPLFTVPESSEVLSLTPLLARGKAEEIPDGREPVQFVLFHGKHGRSRKWPHEAIEERFFQFMVAEIAKSQIPYNQVAILVKDRYQSDRVSKYLERRSIPTHVLQKKMIGQQPAVSMLAAFFRLLEHPTDARKIQEFLAHTHPCDAPLPSYPFQKMGQIAQEKGLAYCMRDFYATLNPPYPQQDLEHLFELLLDAEQRGAITSIAEALDFLYDLAQQTSTADPRLLTRASPYTDAIQILTLHKSKGLEFDVVFALGASTRPYEADSDDPTEKMRLLYVTLTRAKRRLYIPVFCADDSEGGQKATKSLAVLSPLEFFFAKMFPDAAPHELVEKAMEHIARCRSIEIRDG